MKENHEKFMNDSMRQIQDDSNTEEFRKSKKASKLRDSSLNGSDQAQGRKNSHTMKESKKMSYLNDSQQIQADKIEEKNEYKMSNVSNSKEKNEG